MLQNSKKNNSISGWNIKTLVFLVILLQTIWDYYIENKKIRIAFIYKELFRNQLDQRKKIIW